MNIIRMPARRRSADGWRRALVVLLAAQAAMFHPRPGCAQAPTARTSRAGVSQGAVSRVRGHGHDMGRLLGSLTLHRCGTAAYCGRLERALDPSGTVPGHVSVYFEFYPHTDPGPAAGTMVATEGGPGYPATESRGDYLALFKPLMRRRDVLIMDNRGTGKSGALDCHALQTGARWTVESVAACGASLGESASLYGTALAADDLAAILDAAGAGRIDLYGDSYGTYFAQVFAVRHPQALRSVVLDGAYPLAGPDYAWYPTYAPAVRTKFNLACERSPGCAAVDGTAMDHILPALEQLRTAPFDARGFDVDGRERRFRADASQLASVMFGGAPALTTVRETDAAARAFAAGDQRPLVRLMAETAAAVDSRDPDADPTKWSAALAAAVMCHDPPQIFDMRLPPAGRALELTRVLAERRRSSPGTYAPFTIDEYRGMPLDYSFLDECVGWPAIPARDRPVPLGEHAQYPDVPALILSGEFDAITTPADGAAAAFPHGTQILLANSFHVNALPRARSDCGAQIVRRFIATLTPGDTACAGAVPPVRLVPRFAVHAAALPAAEGLAGNAADEARRKAVAAAVFTLGDVLARVNANTSGRGVGLRGGSFRLRRSAAGIRIDLNEVRWVDDLAVSGTLLAGEPGGDGSKHDRSPSSRGVHAALTVAGAGMSGKLVVDWPSGLGPAEAHVTGRMGGRTVAAQMPAP